MSRRIHHRGACGHKGAAGAATRSVLALVAVLALGGLVPASPAQKPQLPPIAVGVPSLAGWHEAPTATPGAAVVLQRAGEGGRVRGTFNVVISEVERPGGSVGDPGVAEGIESELLGVLPNARVTARELVSVGPFKAFRLTAEVPVGAKRIVLRQTTIDVRRGVVTATASFEAAEAPALTPEVDRLVADMTIDAPT